MKMMNEKSKAKSANSAGFSVKAGSAKMSGPNYVGPQTPGQSTSGGQKSTPPVKGGRTGVMGKQGGAAPAMPGMSCCGGRAGDNSFIARGGGRKMAGFTPSSPAKAL